MKILIREVGLSDPVTYRVRSVDLVVLEVSGSRNHPHCEEKSSTGATVTDKGGKFLEIKLANGHTFKKGRDTNGFEARVKGKRIN